MAYNNNIPQPTQTLSRSQGDLLGNFQEIDNWVQTDHVGLNGTVDQGKHKTARFVDQTALPGFGPTDTAFFNAQPNNLGGLAINKQEMHIHAENNSGFYSIPFTASILSENTPANNAEGWTYLPSGIIMKWGVFNMAAAGSDTHNYPTGNDIPVFSNVYSLQVTFQTPAATNRTAHIRASGTTTFTIYAFDTTNGNAVQGAIQYLAIGS